MPDWRSRAASFSHRSRSILRFPGRSRCSSTNWLRVSPSTHRIFKRREPPLPDTDAFGQVLEVNRKGQLGLFQVGGNAAVARFAALGPGG